jgi:Polyketide cyclase / dehydrase and lipid transport
MEHTGSGRDRLACLDVLELDERRRELIPMRRRPTAAYDDCVPVDVQTVIDIDRPRREVAAFASDPENATSWYENIKAVDWKSPKPLAVGSRIAFVAQFLGRRLAYTYEVKELVPDERLVMSTSEGPFAMETTYSWQDTARGGTRMTLRNRGEASGFSKITTPMMAAAMRRANRKDLERLKVLLETRASA